MAVIVVRELVNYWATNMASKKPQAWGSTVNPENTYDGYRQGHLKNVLRVEIVTWLNK